MDTREARNEKRDEEEKVKRGRGEEGKRLEEADGGW